MDNIIFSFRIELFTICIYYPEDVPSKFYRHDLRTETDSEIGDFVLSSISSTQDHPLSPTIPESTRDTDPIEVFEEFRSFFFDVFRLDKSEFYTFLMGKSCSLESFIE